MELLRPTPFGIHDRQVVEHPRPENRPFGFCQSPPPPQRGKKRLQATVRELLAVESVQPMVRETTPRRGKNPLPLAQGLQQLGKIPDRPPRHLR